MLDLRVLDFTGQDAWRWQLTDQDGSLLARHDVRLDRNSAEFGLATDLYRNLWLLDAEPTRLRRSERELLARVGAYLAAEVLGSAGRAIAARVPVTIRVALPPPAVGLLAMPLELADLGDGPLALHGAVFSYVPQAYAPAGNRAEQGAEVRVLAVFALPETSSALGLVQERRTLTRIARDDPLSRGERPVDLRVLQYGATKDMVRRSLDEPEGWDVIHLAGHGGPGRLYLENENGGQETVEAEELLRWLAPCCGRTRLVVLSACESGVARAARILGTRRRSPQAPAVRFRALGYEIAQTLGCTVLATRYPVDDKFSVTFGRMWYEAVLRDGQPADEAVRTALPRAVRATPGAPLSISTPILLGTPDVSVRLPDPHWQGAQVRTRGRRRAVMSGVPGEASRFVGRTTLLARIGRALAADSGITGIVITGMPGIGKTAVITEAVHRYADTFEDVTWHRATRRDSARSLARILAGTGHDADLADLAGAARSARSRRTLLVVDSAHSLLADTGVWRGDLGSLMAMLLQPGARSRVVLICDRQLPGLPTGVVPYTVPMLSRSESEWLARELQETRQEAAGAAVTATGARPVGLAWLACRGHPRLIEYCSAGTPEEIRRRTVRVDQAWEITSPLAPGTSGALRPLGRAHPGSLITAWACERVAELPAAAQRALCFLACIEQPHRISDLVSPAWQVLAETTGVDVGPLDEAAAPCESAGLAECTGDGEYLLHPGIVHAGRGLNREVSVQTVRSLYLMWKRYYQDALDEPAPSEEVLGYCAASSVPYLMRMGRWERASEACEQAINHDSSPSMAARLLPYDVEIVRAAHGTPLQLTTTFVYAELVRALDEDRGLTVLTRLHDRAVRDNDDITVLVTATSIASLLARKDPHRAYEFLKIAQGASAAAQNQPWLGVLLQNIEAEICYEFGDSAAALTRAQAVLHQLDQLAAAGTQPQGVNPHSQRGAALSTAATAASALGQQELAEDYRRRLTGHDENSGQRAAAQTQFNAIQELIGNGRLDQAQALLLAAWGRFDAPGDIGMRGLILIGLAQIEHRLGHHEDAITLGRRALRASYAAAERLDAAAAHARTANFLATGPRHSTAEAPVHILAAAVIHMRVSQMLLAITPQQPTLRALARLTHCLARQPQLVPQSLGELRQKLAESTDIDISGLLAGLDRFPVSVDPESGEVVLSALPPGAEPPGDSVTDALCWALHRPSPRELVNPGDPSYQYHWQPAIEAVIDAIDDQTARTRLREVLDDYRGMGWAGLADALDALITDRSAFRMPPTLQDAERDIIQRILDALPR